MSERLPWGKFNWGHWETDPCLALCSMAAQGFWMRLLCMCAKEDGYLLVNGRSPTLDELAFFTRQTADDVSEWLSELEQKGVFSRDRRKVIYSRRMVKDTKKSRTARENGKLGGNPTLGKTKKTGASVNPDKEEDREEETERDNPPPPLQGDTNELFEQALTAYPQAGRASTHRVKSAEAWALACEIEPPARLLTAVKAFAASDYASAEQGKRVPSFQRWLRELRFLVWLPVCASAVGFAGPADLRSIVVAAKGEAFAVGYLDRCGWQDVPERALTTVNGFIAATLRREVRSILAAQGVIIVVEATAGSDAGQIDRAAKRVAVPAALADEALSRCEELDSPPNATGAS